MWIFPKYCLQVHDEVKDKMFELELSWVGEFTDGVHKRVPEEVSEKSMLKIFNGVGLLVSALVVVEKS